MASKVQNHMELMEPTNIYNIINQCFNFPAVSDPSYLLLIDARETHEYNESHVVTAKKAPKNSQGAYIVPPDAELECKTNIVVYDGTTQSLDDEESAAVKCAQVLVNAGSRNPVQVVCGGYERFSALYPFLRTQKIIWLPQELDNLKTYPLEVIPGLLYLGNRRHADAAYIQKDLKIQGQVNCTQQPGEIFLPDSPHLHTIPINDEDISVKEHLSPACAFIDSHIDKKEPVLVFSDLGFSRSAMLCIAYLTHRLKLPAQSCYQRVQSCSMYACPNTSFLDQLHQWHTETVGSGDVKQ